MFEKLLQKIKTENVLENQDIELVKQYFEPVLIPKNKILEEYGKTPTYIYFVVSGYVRLYHYNDEGDEITTHINCPPGFITSYDNFIKQIKSNEMVESITECELLRITKHDLDTLTSNSEALKNFSILMLQESNSYIEKRARELATLSAKQRYYNLMKQSPDILYNVPLRYVATFLGMKPESLSRIRKKVIN